jgi:hypothetical protein
MPARMPRRVLLRIPRRLFTLCSAVSLLLCVALCASWALGLHTDGGPRSRQPVLKPPEQTSFAFGFSGSQLTIAMTTPPYALGTPAHVRYGRSEFLGVSVGREARYGELINGRVTAWLGDTASVTISSWYAVLATAIAPAWAVVHQRRRRRRSLRGLCPVCGYDLRASPERCPECGTPAK